MTEHTSPTIFLIPSLTIAWALWDLEDLCPLILKGFSMEQQDVSMHIMVLISLPLEVTWSLCVHPIRGLGTVWAVLGHKG